MIGHILFEMFSWPGDNVLGNLMASAIRAAPALMHIHRTINQHALEPLAAANHEQLAAAMDRHPAGSAQGKPYGWISDQQLIGEVLDRLQGWH